jgi:hypothetical protein
MNGPSAPEEPEVINIFQSLDTINGLFFFYGIPFYNYRLSIKYVEQRSSVNKLI